MKEELGKRQILGKNQCRYCLDFGNKLIYSCLRKFGHKGKHQGMICRMGKTGKLLEHKDFYWDNLKTK